MRARIGAVIGVSVFALTLVSAQSAAGQVTTPGDCFVSDGGRIFASATEPATFGGSAATDRGVTLGHQVYVDQGALTGFQFRSLTMNALLCDLDAHRADMFGTGQVQTQTGPNQVVTYQISVADLDAARQVPDFYRIRLSNGYDSGEQPVQGNINVTGR